MDSRAQSGRRSQKESEWDPNQVPLSELVEIQKRKVADLNLSVEPAVSVSHSESEDLLPLVCNDIQRNFSFTLARNAEKCGFKRLRTVQQAIIPYMNDGCNICLATTGCTGKTTGYLLPLIQNVCNDFEKHPHKPYQPRAFIVVSTKERGKQVYDLLRILTDGLDVKICISFKGMPESNFKERDHADIVVISPRILRRALEENRAHLSFLKYLVLEGIDDLHSDTDSDGPTLSPILAYLDEMASQAKMITVLDDISLLDSVFCNDRVLNCKNTVIIDNGGVHRLSPSNHLLLRVNRKTMVNAVLEIMQSNNQGKVLIVLRRNDHKPVELEMKMALENAGIAYFYFHPKLDMPIRAEVLHRFALEERQVLVMPYCNQMKGLRFPGLSQIIHVTPPFHEDEKYEVSYNYTSSCIAFNPKARSVVLFDVENNLNAGCAGKLAKAISKCPVVEGWATNKFSTWTTELMHKRKSWTKEDKKAADEMVDLKEGLTAPFEVSDHPEQSTDYADQERYQGGQQNFEFGGNQRNSETSSFVPPSPAPFGDVYDNYKRPMYRGGNYSQIANSPPPQRSYYHGNNCQRSTPSNSGQEWNERGFSRNESRQVGSHFDEPDEVPEYDDFEEENIGYREFCNSGSSKGQERDRRTSSSSYDHQGQGYYQEGYSDRSGSRCQECSNYAPSGSRQEYYGGRQNQPYQDDYSARQRPRYEEPQMRPRQGSYASQNETEGHQNWQIDHRPSNRQIEERQDFRRGNQMNSGDRPMHWNKEEPRYYNEYQDVRVGNQSSHGNRPAQSQQFTGSWDTEDEHTRGHEKQQGRQSFRSNENDRLKGPNDWQKKDKKRCGYFGRGAQGKSQDGPYYGHDDRVGNEERFGGNRFASGNRGRGGRGGHSREDPEDLYFYSK